MAINFLKASGLALAAWIAVMPAAGQTKATGSFPPAGYKLRWLDTFDGASLDLSNWMYRTDVKASSSQTPDNVRVEGGNLVISMRKQEDRGKQYTGGGVISREHFHYGYFEARAKLFGGAGWHESVGLWRLPTEAPRIRQTSAPRLTDWNSIPIPPGKAAWA